MKEVVLKEEVKIVDLSSINNSSIVGIEWGDGNKFYVCRGQGGFFGCPLIERDITSKWIQSSIKDYVKDCIETRLTKAFVFESEDELLQWLLKK
ncbi:hypothetical protein [Flavobacterium sp.]|uniref:hypothetical protein n=1 Tax=Flavobacterium sp. TaxID=239 RepID=UPI0025F8A23A|nr:hypothetical protein [Flavobacterium sp.]